MPCGTTCSKANLARHKNTCKACEVIKTLKKEYEDLHKSYIALQTTEQSKHILNMENTITELRQLCKEKDDLLKEQCNVDKRQKVNVDTIIPFGLEPHVCAKEVKAILSQPTTSVSKYIELRHFKNKETGNIRIPNKRGNTCQVVKDSENNKKRWVEQDKKGQLINITESALDELRERYQAEKISIWKNWYVNNKLDQDGFDTTREFKNILQQVEHVILTNRVK